MPSKPTVAAKGWVTCSATISAPMVRAKQTPLLAAWAESLEPSVGIRIFLNIRGSSKTLTRRREHSRWSGEMTVGSALSLIYARFPGRHEQIRAARPRTAEGQHRRRQLAQQPGELGHVGGRDRAADHGLVARLQSGRPGGPQHVVGQGLFGAAFAVRAVDDDGLEARVRQGLHVIG